jgi:hypothetical protein
MKMTLLLLACLSLSVFAAELPADAAALKGKRDAKIAEINQLYANELEKIQKVALKNGSLEAANAIEKEIATVAVNPLNPLQSIIGKWKRVGSGTKYDGDLIQFTDEKSGVFNGKEMFKTRYNPSKNLITIENNNWNNEITLTGNPDTLNGKSDKGLVYQLVRVK